MEKKSRVYNDRRRDAEIGVNDDTWMPIMHACSLADQLTRSEGLVNVQSNSLHHISIAVRGCTMCDRAFEAPRCPRHTNIVNISSTLRLESVCAHA